MSLLIVWVSSLLSILSFGRVKQILLSFSIIWALIIIYSYPLGGDYESLSIRGFDEINGYSINKDYILLVISSVSIFVGLDTPQLYSYIIILNLIILKNKFNIDFLIYNLIFLIYHGVTGYHRQYLSTILLAWVFSYQITNIKFFLFLALSFLVHGSAIFLSLVILISKIKIHFKKINIIKKIFLMAFFMILTLSQIELISSYLMSNHYLFNYIGAPAENSEGAIYRIMAGLISFILYLTISKKIQKTYNEILLVNIVIILFTISIIFLLLNLTTAADRNYMNILFLLAILYSIKGNILYGSVKNKILIISPIITIHILWLFLSEKSRLLW